MSVKVCKSTKNENSVINLLEFISASKLKTVCNAFIQSQANHETIPPSKKNIWSFQCHK
jgi:hypothetical protein